MRCEGRTSIHIFYSSVITHCFHLPLCAFLLWLEIGSKLGSSWSFKATAYLGM